VESVPKLLVPPSMRVCGLSGVLPAVSDMTNAMRSWKSLVESTVMLAVAEVVPVL
jgi:hypothetical protein